MLEIIFIDYEIFAEVLTQRPLKTTNFTLGLKLTDEDLRKITEFTKNRFDEIMAVLKDMPSHLLLVLR